MGLTSCRWITIAKTLARRRRGAHRHHAGCRVAVDRAADRYTLICDGPLVSAALLTALKADGFAITEPSSQRRRGFTIWLGRRYDRPAVPPGLVPLARKISEVVKAKRNRLTGARVRDVLMQFDESVSPPRFSLFAILENEADEHEVRAWLAGISLEIPTYLGLADQVEAATARGISLQLIETSYAADVSQVTWRPGKPDPEGAV